MVGLLLYPLAPFFAFVLGGLTALLSALLLAVWFPEESMPVAEEGQAPLRWQDHTLSLGTAWYQGFLEGGMLTFLSAYLLNLGYPETTASGLLAALFLGVVLVQLPGAFLADRLGLRPSLVACHALVLTGLALLPFCRAILPLALLLGLVGSASALLYPLGLALVGERVPASALTTANSWYLASNCLGSLTGPWVLGLAMDRWGQQSFFLTGIVAGVLVLSAWRLFEQQQRQRRRQPVRRWVYSESSSRKAA